ncbi:efflux transporter outer membrane subunit [Cupriavidus plantarum]|uniref:NodT family efflux transporter outer membrane factor (OMF) lipoprotein n=1 Tax=Cupriavidus plantarum TaxID=942865 RepID=A0A316EPB5_9BURK|nr:TolC family protein [Cupriavidus plantarum]PWK34148.1 NodT family efflux transporter outer membrane factor (OMF) lipoprotein [Cupriavidus plantarum]
MKQLKPLLCLLALALTGCAVGPDYVSPAVPVNAEGAFTAGEAPSLYDQSPARDDWWRLYRDPILDRLIEDALAANIDVRVAVARLERARAMLRDAGADRYPGTEFDATASRQRQAAVQALPGQDRQHTLVDAGFGIAYEIDLFGRVRRGVESARGDFEAAQADRDAVKVAIVADTTRAYLNAAGAAQRLAVAQRIVALLDRSLRVMSGRERAGMATSLDTARIAALREQRHSNIPVIAAERQAALFRLAVLTGRAPGELPADAADLNALPTLDMPIPVGDGRSMLARRPDVRAAERRLAAATARIGVATADLYPRISFGATIGSTGFGAGDFFGAGPLRWLAGPSISWSFPNQERIRARISAAEADSAGALATFDGSVLQALAETETALSNYARAVDQRTALAAAREQADRAARIVRAQQREGRSDSLALLDAERTFADAQAQVADAEERIANAQVDLFRALGGGWASEPLRTM